MTTKEIEDYINTYRMYPDEYTGVRDLKILDNLNRSYRYNVKDNTITRLEGYIDNNGDFVLGETYIYSLDNPNDKKPATVVDKHFRFKLNKYNAMMKELDHEVGIVTDTVNANWNLRDMVSEVEYLRSLYYTPGNERYKLKVEDLILFNRHTSRLRHFLRENRDYIDDLIVTVKHNSKYDN